MSELKAERAAFKAAIDKCAKRVSGGIRSTFRNWCSFVVGLLKAGTAQRLHRHTGNLIKSITVFITGEKSDTQAKFLARAKYAKLQEYGGTVRAVRAKMLAIPAEGSPALTAAGVPRYASPLRNSLPTNYSFWVARFGSKLALMGAKKAVGGKRSNAKNARPQVWYWLRKSVKIPPRLRMRETIRNAIDKLKAQMAAGVKRG
jgi:hypothetical protein